MDSNQAEQAQVALPNQQRLLRAHPNDDEESEERVLDADKLRRMYNNKVSASDYATKLGIVDDIAMAMKYSTALNQLLSTHKYEKYMTYLNYVTKKNNNKKPGRITYE